MSCFLSSVGDSNIDGEIGYPRDIMHLSCRLFIPPEVATLMYKEKGETGLFRSRRETLKLENRSDFRLSPPSDPITPQDNRTTKRKTVNLPIIIFHPMDQRLLTVPNAYPPKCRQPDMTWPCQSPQLKVRSRP